MAWESIEQEEQTDMDLDAAHRRRDRRLRKALLRTVHAARIAPKGGVHGRVLMATVDDAVPPADRHQDDDHCIGLLRDLEAKGLIELADERTRRTQRYGLDYLFARVTAKGTSLLQETIDPDPDIDDERNLEE